MGATVAVDAMSCTVGHGETLGVVGESGCGKSVTALSVMRLIQPPGKIVGGRILLQGRDILALSETEMRRVRGNAISMIFQDPMTSLNPVLTIGQQIAEIAMLHQGLSRKDALDRAAEMLRTVHIPDHRRKLDDYPHQLSGGMRQRVMIAMALICAPQVLIADEPTTALDVTIQAQILDLLAELQETAGTAIVLITHDLGVVSQMARRVVVMYAGQKVEEGAVDELFAVPLHPYTVGLMAGDAAFRGRQDRKAPRAARRDSRHRAVAAGAAAGLPFRAALRDRHPALPRRTAAACRASPIPLAACWRAGEYQVGHG